MLNILQKTIVGKIDTSNPGLREGCLKSSTLVSPFPSVRAGQVLTMQIKVGGDDWSYLRGCLSHDGDGFNPL